MFRTAVCKLQQIKLIYVIEKSRPIDVIIAGSKQGYGQMSQVLKWD